MERKSKLEEVLKSAQPDQDPKTGKSIGTCKMWYNKKTGEIYGFAPNYAPENFKGKELVTLSYDEHGPKPEFPRDEEHTRLPVPEGCGLQKAFEKLRVYRKHFKEEEPINMTEIDNKILKVITNSHNTSKGKKP